MNDKYDLSELMHLMLRFQHLDNSRYLAEPVPGFGICVYKVPSLEDYCLACFPMLRPDARLQNAFIKHIGKMAGRLMPPEEEARLRNLYPYREAPDVLTLKCLIEEAVLNWSNLNVQPD